MTNLATYIKIFNDTPLTLFLEEKDTIHGYWETDPPYKVEANSQSEIFELKDHKSAASGSEGMVAYKVALSRSIVYFEAKFCCSWSAKNNYVYFGTDHAKKFATSFVTIVDGKTYYNDCPESGHPILLYLNVQKHKQGK